MKKAFLAIGFAWYGQAATEHFHADIPLPASRVVGHGALRGHDSDCFAENDPNVADSKPRR